jgi:hypothetical protein
MAKAATIKKAPADLVEMFDDVEQGSEAWFDLRRGLPTSSKFAYVLAGGEEARMRTKYLRQLAGEIVSGETAETFQSEEMKRGKLMEPAARAYYERTHLVDLRPIGFIRRTLRSSFPGTDCIVGASPDSQVGKRKGLEVKTMRPDLLLEVKQRGAAGFPSEHRAQTQGTMLVADWDEVDLLLFYDGRNGPMSLKFNVTRDDAFIARLRDELEKFSYELRKLVEQWKNM